MVRPSIGWMINVMKASHSIVRTIWFCLAILILGYTISLVSGVILGRKTENRLAGVSEKRFPIAQMGEMAVVAYKEQIRVYSDAILIGDVEVLNQADEKAVEVGKNLDMIVRLQSDDDHRRKHVIETQRDLEKFNADAKEIYSQICRNLNAIYDNPDLPKKVEDLAALTKVFQDRLEKIAFGFSEDLRNDLAEVKRINRRQRYIAAILAVISALVGGLGVGFLTVRRIVRPVQELAGVARQIQAGDLHKQAGVRTHDEIGELAVAFNSMTRQLAGSMESLQNEIEERKQIERELQQHKEHLEEMVQERSRELEAAQAQLVKREKLAVLGQLTATVSHELRNPLGVIQTSAFFLQKKLTDLDEKGLKHLNRIDEQVRICDRLVEELLEYTRGRHCEMIETKVNSWILETLGQIPLPEQVIVTQDLAPDLPRVLMDQQKMWRVLINLMNNAILAVTERGRLAGGGEQAGQHQPQIMITTRNHDDHHILIIIEDNGVGMDEATLRQAFEPLFTTRARGTGLGLAIVRKIVEEHGGAVSLESRPNAGTKVEIRLRASLAIAR